MRRIVSIIATAAAAITIAACATDGGIDGTGNRVDCEKAREPMPQECKPR